MHPRVVQAILSTRTDALLHGLGWLRSPLKRRADFFYRADDPYCLLLLQVLPELQRRTGVSIRTHVVPQPDRSAMPQPELAARLARRDALELCRFQALRFDASWQTPTGARLEEATAAALAAPDLHSLATLTEAAWSGASLEGFPRAASVADTLARNAARLRRGGHYFSGMLHYRGEWYWGVDRLNHLEARLDCDPLVAQRDEIAWPDRGPEGPIDFYFSFRSPYSYLALARTRALAERFEVEFRVRPVLPMVMRGLEVPFAKRIYIVRDCAREARRLGIPFGLVADPVGVGVERCLAVYLLAESRGLGLEWMHTAATAIWSRGVDVASDAGLRGLVEEVGLDWAEAQAAMADDAWRAAAEANREALLAAGLWGVPCYVWGDLHLWGQDRIEVLEAWLQHFG